MSENTDSKSDELLPIGTRDSFALYIRRVVSLLHFIGLRARLRSFTGSNGTILGKAWLILEPFMMIGMYYVIFGLLIQTSRGIDNFVAFLAIGLIFFRRIQSSLSEGSGIIAANRGIIRAFPIPRASLVLSDAVKKMFDTIPDLIALLVFIAIVPPGVKPSLTWLLAVPVMFLALVFSTGITFITARVSASVPDLKHLWPIVGRFWFYGSGVIFSIDHYVHNETVKTILQANPAAVIIEGARECILYDSFPNIGVWVQMVGWAAFTFVIGFVVFWQGEEKYNREL